MPTIFRSHKIFHDDDITLVLEHPKAMGCFTALAEVTLVRRYEVFARIFFNHVFSKSRKDFSIELDPETKEYVYVYKSFSSDI